MPYLALILIAVASRFLPHPPNVMCLGAIGLFAGCYFRSAKAFLIPMAVLLVSDIVGQLLRVPGMGFYQPVTMLSVYVGATLAVVIGRWVGNQHTATAGSGMRFGSAVLGGSLIASTLFFLVSNLGVWAAGWYPMTLSGLASCFIAAIPFYGYTLAGDLGFTALMFGGYEVSRRFSSAGKLSPVRV